MKRLFSCALSLLLCAAAFIPQAGAYDYREDGISDDATVSLTDQMLDAIMEQYTSTIGGQSSVMIASTDTEYELCLDRAVHVYRYTPEDYIAALENGLSAELKTHEWTVWKVPLTGGSGCNYAVIQGDGFSTCYSDTPTESLAFLWDPELVDSKLQGLSGDIYVTSIPIWGITLYVRLEGADTYLMADAGQPDWFGIENWTWYTPEEMLATLQAFAALTEAGGSGGGGGALSDNATFWDTYLIPICLGAGALLLVVLSILLPKLRKDG